LTLADKERQINALEIAKGIAIMKNGKSSESGAKSSLRMLGARHVSVPYRRKHDGVLGKRFTISQFNWGGRCKSAGTGLGAHWHTFLGSRPNVVAPPAGASW